jgi:hypothetical protein
MVVGLNVLSYHLKLGEVCNKNLLVVHHVPHWPESPSHWHAKGVVEVDSFEPEPLDHVKFSCAQKTLLETQNLFYMMAQ